MRLREPIIENGFFWSPDKPDSRMPGTISITDGGEISLQITEDFIGQGFKALKKSTEPCPSLFFGIVEKLGHVTLDGCWSKRTNANLAGLTQSTIHVERLLTNGHFSETENFSFNQFRFTVDGIEEWLGIKPINVDFDEDYKGGTIKFQAPPKTTLVGNFNGFTLQLDYNWTMPYSISAEARVSIQPFLLIQSIELRPLADFNEASFRIVQFIRFALGKPVSLSKVSLARDDYQFDISDSKKQRVNIDIYYRSRPFSQTKPEIEARSILFYFDAQENRTGVMLEKWFELFEKSEISLGLYFSQFAGDYKYLSNQFLTLAQALETLHRRTADTQLFPTEIFRTLKESLISAAPKEHKDWLNGRLQYANEVSLKQRLKDLFAPFDEYFGSEQRKPLIRQIVDTRNFLTHYDESLKSRAAEGRALWILVRKMDALLMLIFLQQMGLNASEIAQIARNDNRLKDYLRSV
jgi:hypothetical protein